jgi:hypothetical protein
MIAVDAAFTILYGQTAVRPFPDEPAVQRQRGPDGGNFLVETDGIGFFAPGCSLFCYNQIVTHVS